jgi:hypothetical protein
MTQLLVPAPKPLIRSSNCGNCRFAVPVGKGAECRRNPPTTFLMSGQHGPMPVAAWPPIGPEQFCGEWKTKIEGATV